LNGVEYLFVALCVLLDDSESLFELFGFPFKLCFLLIYFFSQLSYLQS